MYVFEKFREQSKALYKTIVLPEGEDTRIIDAAAIVCKEKIAKPILLGDEKEIKEQLLERGVSEGFGVIEPANHPRVAEFGKMYYEMRKNKGETLKSAIEILKNPLYFGVMLVEAGAADGCLAGVAHTTADVLRAALRIIKRSAGVDTISSCFIMASNIREIGVDGIILFADCAVNPDPNPKMLADIAISTATTCKTFLNVEPKVAMLSFSTKGSGESDSVEKVAKAIAITHELAPDLLVDGEMQVDAALIPAIGARKAPGSNVAGHANVLIFPNLDAANIGYKLVERFSGALAVGPVLQGLSKPVNDLSRGASVADIVNMVAVTSVQAR